MAMPGTSVITIERFIMDQERLHPEATGELSNLLYDIALAGKIISRQVRRAGLEDILGSVGAINIQGEMQQKLDVYANDTLKSAVGHGGRVCVMGSEEDEGLILPPSEERAGKYAVLFDPLDGSSNIDVNISIGTIFSIYLRRSSGPGSGTLEDLVRRGREQVAAGYVIYGSSTVMVYSTGFGVHGFTLEPSIGEFLLSHSQIRTPEVGKYYSVNESNFQRWSAEVRRAVRGFKEGDGALKGRNARYIGSLVADVHRNLVAGGVFLYPADTRSPRGKLRLLYEASPLAFLVEQAGGAATDGTEPILDLEPTELHQRTPLVIGSRADVLYATEMIAGAARDTS
jgi:fructose-1,6-bisphosphatase I